MSDLFSGVASSLKSVANNVAASINTSEVRKLAEKMQDMVMNFSDEELAVRDATNEDPWGPTGPEMKKICDYTFNGDSFHPTVAMLWKRMFEDNKSAWRRVYKSLKLLNYLIQNGSERVLQSARDHLFEIRALESYKFTDEKGRDQGVNIRHRAKIIIELLSDDTKLREERQKAKADNKSRYRGYTSDELRYANFDSNNHSERSFGGGAQEEREREVSSYQFADDKKEDAGLADDFNVSSPVRKSKSAVVDDDDGFGDFVSARTANNKKMEIKIAPLAQAIPPPPSANVSPVSSSTPAKIVAPSMALDDLLGLNSAISTSPTLFQPVQAAPTEFPDFFSIQATSTSAAKPAASLSLNDDFGNFVTSPATNSPMSSMSATPMAPQPSSDFFSGDLFATPISPVTASQLTAPVQSSVQNPQDFSKQPMKVGSTWANATNLVDFDLSVKQNTSKNSPSLNQLQKGKFN